jgi:hypothetical protein
MATTPFLPSPSGRGAGGEGAGLIVSNLRCHVPRPPFMLARSDPKQLTYAIHETRLCLTANYDDYEDLHLLVREAQGKHPGIVVVRQENDPTRDLTPKGIVAALRELEAAAVPVANEYIVLNHWR